MPRCCRLLPLALLLLASLTLLLGTSTATPAAAMTYVLVDDPALTDQADVIVEAVIVDSQVRTRASGTIVTDTTVVPQRFLKGFANGTELTVRTLGGVHSSGRFLHVFGTPELRRDQRVLLFLKQETGGDLFAPYRILHVAQGAFFATRVDGRDAWVRNLDAEGRQSAIAASSISHHHGSSGHHHHHQPTTADASTSIPVPVDAESATLGRDAERFAQWIEARVAGAPIDVDYRVQVTPAGARAAFTLLGDNQQFRWFRFDRGQVTRWFRDGTGQPGLADGGAEAFRKARVAWNSEPNTPVAYRNGGTTGNRSGFSALDDQNTILFRDYANDIDTDFDCGTGGTLAIGGVSGVTSLTATRYKGLLFLDIAEAEVVINDGTECWVRDNQGRAEELYTHELGHTLGLGHSCGDDASPPCTDPVLDAAIMRASANIVPLGSELGTDDIAGLRFLYDANASVTGPCNLDPGHPRYCTECGPCGSGVGDCDSDDECAGNLVCAEDRGPDFGFGARVDVCLAPGGGNGGGGGNPNPNPNPNPTPDPNACPIENGQPGFCNRCGPCAAGQGDCNEDTDCLPGLVCVQNNGPDFGFRPALDVCVPPPDFVCPVPIGTNNYCTLCGPCGPNEGDCDSDAECGPGLRCVEDIGPNFGWGARVDVCQ
ncbi:MAG: hypothetical protein AAF772_02830 [Acidobacteriota bacterium]